MYRNASIFAFACVLAAAGCRNNSPLTPADLSMAGGGGGGTGGGAGVAGDMAVTVSTIPAMRMGAPGTYELDNVLVIAKTSSSSSPHLVLQDPNGGDYSAIYTTCSSTSTSHPCPATSDNKTAQVGDSLTVTGLYIKAATASGATETFYINSITDNGPAGGTPPVAVTVTLADLAKGNGLMTKKNWFQKVVVSPAPAAGALKMYDFVPTEMVFTGSTCPKQVGWGMVPSATTACTGNTVMCPTPTNCSSPDASEVLIGTEFYKQFTPSSDCACAKTDMGTGSPLVEMSTATTGAISGILLYDSVFGSSPVVTYQYLSPTADTDMPLMPTM